MPAHPPTRPPAHPLTRSLNSEQSSLNPFRWAILAGVMLLAAGLRLWGLGELGFRYADEGTYALFGMEMLKGSRGFIYYKSGQAALTWLAFNVFGVSMFSPMLLSALLGIASVLLIYLVTRELYGEDAGLVSAVCAAAMPYLLYYHRSALSDGNYLFLDLVGLYLALLGVRQGRWALFAAAGAAWGLAYDVKPQGFVIPVGVMAGVWLAAGRNPPGSAPDSRKARVFLLIALAAAFLAHAALAMFMKPFMDAQAAGSVLNSYVRGLFDLRMAPGLRFLTCLMVHGCVAVALLSALGVVRAARRRSASDVLCLAMALVAAAYSARVNVLMPRFHVTLVLPALLLAGAGAATVVEIAGKKANKHALALTVILLGVVCVEMPSALRVLRMKPGYREACEWLRREEGLTAGVTTHSWTILAAGTGKRWVMASDAIAGALAKADGDRMLEQELIPAMLKNGYSHLVLDYALWARLRPEGEPNLRRFIADHPPTHIVPNDYLWHPQTLAEGELPARLAREPLAQSISVWRLRDVR